MTPTHAPRPSFATLTAAALPFVARALRPPRATRLVALSAVLGALTLFLGLWLGLGSGPFEQGVRETVGFEENRWERTQRTFTLEARTRAEAAKLEHAVESLQVAARTSPVGLDVLGGGDVPWEVRGAMSEAAYELDRAARVQAPAEHRELQAAAIRLAARPDVQRLVSHRDAEPWFGWGDARATERLAAIVARGAAPAVVVYRSPLSGYDALRLAGMIAGGVWIVLMVVLVPCLAGVQLAQEVHENTLPPLTGTALVPWQLAVGLTSPALVIAALVGAPQLAIALLTAMTLGYAAPMLALVPVTIAAGLLLAVLAQLYGLVLGRRRAPGLLGISLLMITVFATFTGLGFGLGTRDELAGVLAVLPHAAAFHLLREAFSPAGQLSPDGALLADVALVLGTLGATVVGGLGLRALARRITGEVAASFTRIEGLVLAATVSVLAIVAVVEPLHREVGEALLVVSLAVVLPSLIALTSARVPVGDVPACLRRVPARALLGELTLWVALHVGLVVLVWSAVGERAFVRHLWHAGALVHMAWAIAVAGLLAIRVTALPVSVQGLFWAAFVGAASFSGYVFGAGAIADGDTTTPFLALTELSPMLGLAQAVLLVWIPWSLARAIRRGSAPPA
jgi:hypothetical protein